jgi:RNA polymerase sigma-70 factor (ECF subfamily)
VIAGMAGAIAVAECLMPTPARVTVGMSEDDLIARWQAGDIEAFGRIYAEYNDPIFRHAYYLLGSVDDAQDVQQETFVRAFRAAPSFRGDCSLRTWLFRVCTNLCRDTLRRRRDNVSLDCAAPELAHSGPSIDPAVQAEQEESVALLRSALAEMSAADRELIVLRDLEGLGTREVAAIIGCAPASVPVKLFRARSRLKERVRRLIDERK